ncbi:MAG: penicillin-binding transpeptidase domain-containing protein [Actinobacteria bacterium]|nr:penicillin-binding transpeptidase domain-containing protein [Actinomycetota bacterium]
MNKNIKNIFLAIVILFAAISINLIYTQLVNPQTVLGHPENLRYILDEAMEPRGDIYSKDGALLAQSKQDGQLYLRYYPYGEIFEPMLGFFNPKYGKSGIEQALDNYISHKKWPRLIGTISRLISMNLSDEPSTITLTIDSRLQKKAYDLLSGRRGAVVAMNPKSGEVFVLVSSPSFDPNRLVEDWEVLLRDEDAPFLNRATMGLYPPGSIYKIITTAAALENEIGINKTVNCAGELKVEGNTITEFEGSSHGEVDLEQAFAKSCNIFFASLSLDLGSDLLSRYSSRFGFGDKIPFELSVQKSQLGLTDQNDDVALAWTGIGQAKVLVTPLQMALVASAIANDGIIMEPHLLENIKSSDGKLLQHTGSKILFRALEKQTADKISEMMQDVVENGTGKAACVPGTEVAGKTGTAEVGTDERPHSWFIGFAPAKNPAIALSIIVENGGTGGVEAAHLFKEIVSEYLKEF